MGPWNSGDGGAVPIVMATATVNDTLIARSDDTVVVAGNHSFPLGSVADGVLVDSDHTTRCPWKGLAHHHHHLVVDGERLQDAAWSYPEPFEAATHVAGRVAFSPVVAVEV